MNLVWRIKAKFDFRESTKKNQARKKQKNMGKRDSSQLTNIDRDLLALTSTQKKRKTSYDDDFDDEDDYVSTNNKRTNYSDEDEDEKMYREEEFDDGYDESLVGDEEDRRRLDSLSNVEKEQIIFARWESREQLKKKKERLMKEGRIIPRGGSAADKKKSTGKKAATSKSSSSSSTSSGGSDVHKDRSKMDKKSAIADIGARRKAIKEKKKSHHKRSDDFFDDEDEEDDRRRSSSPYGADDDYVHEDVKLPELQKILITRSQLHQWFNEPYFESTVKGCYVRVLLGENDRGERTYRLAEIYDLVTGREYSFEGKKISTYLMVKHGVSKRKFQMELVSNQPSISDTEFAKWKEEMIKCQEHFPTIEFMEQKQKDIKKTSDYKYTDKELADRMKVLNPNKYYTEKYRLEAMIDESNSDDLKQQYQEELDKLNQTWDNQRKNTENAFKRRIDAEELHERAKRETQRLNLIAKKANEKKTSGLDPFARRSTVSSFFSFSSDPSPQTPKKSPADVEKKQEDQFTLLKSPGASLVESHQFELDIDIDLNEVSKATQPTIPARSVPAPEIKSEYTGHKVLSLAEYQKRRGINV